MLPARLVRRQILQALPRVRRALPTPPLAPPPPAPCARPAHPTRGRVRRRPNGERSQSSKEAWRKVNGTPPSKSPAVAKPRAAPPDGDNGDNGETHGVTATLSGLERWGAPLPLAAAVLAGTPAADAPAARGVTSQFMSYEELANANATNAANAAASAGAALATGAAATAVAVAAATAATTAAGTGMASPGVFQCRYGCGFTTRHSMGLGGHTRGCRLRPGTSGNTIDAVEPPTAASPSGAATGTALRYSNTFDIGTSALHDPTPPPAVTVACTPHEVDLQLFAGAAAVGWRIEGSSAAACAGAQIDWHVDAHREP